MEDKTPDAPNTEEKTLNVTNMEELKEKVSDVEVHGDPGKWVCVGKASSKSQGWMKSTKVMEIGGDRAGPVPGFNGCLVQVSTQQKNEDGTYAVAEALAYVPNARLHMFQ